MCWIANEGQVKLAACPTKIPKLPTPRLSLPSRFLKRFLATFANSLTSANPQRHSCTASGCGEMLRTRLHRDNDPPKSAAFKMKNRKIQVILVGAILAVLGFWLWQRPLAPSVSPAASAAWAPTTAQAKLTTTKLWLGSQQLVAEIAREPLEIATGLMFRTTMASDEAMIFVLPMPQQARFYMKNTLIPLSCAYIDGEGVVLEVHNMKPKDETTILSASENVQFVLEVNQGWFEKKQIGPGTLIRTGHGPLSMLLRSRN